MKKRTRKIYYDAFSRFYDRFVAFHSSDAQGAAREFLSNMVPVREGNRILDMCTGTGSLLLRLRKRVGSGGLVVGVDFSRGMLHVNQKKTEIYENICLVEADAAALPFHAQSFDAVTCSHAFYELKGESQEKSLQEILRLLKPGKVFLMMEHDLPEKPLLRAMFYLRLASMGAKRALSILRHEKMMLDRYFRSVEKVIAPTGRSKIMICRK
jgi:ubiquinone/menaquinone biosynthesis C-methylase UbiE